MKPKRGFLRATRLALARFVATGKLAPSNRYEAGRRWQWGDRSTIWSEVTDARYDINQGTRWELLRKARYFEANSALVQRLADVWEQYTVGQNGLVLLPDSDDEDWSERAVEWFEEWAQYPDLTSLQSWATLQSLISRLWFIDGECFIVKTRSQAPPFRPRVQVIESHRVSTPEPLATLEGTRIIDGVELDDRGRPVAYYVQDGFEMGKHARIPAANIAHVMEPVRAGQYRGLTHFYSVLNDLHDLDDLEKLEMQAAKDAAETTKIIKTPTGEVNEDIDDWTGQNVSPTGTPNPLTEYYRQSFGASTKVLKIGDEYNQFLSNRPTVTQQWYWKYMTDKVCSGVGVPLVMVFPDSLQGTVYRGVLDMAAAFFRSRSKVLESAFADVWRYVMEAGSQFDTRIADKPADWKKLVCRPPRAPNVDVGRNSTAMLAELEANVRTYQDIFAETGDDWKQKFRQRKRENEYLKKLGLTPEQAKELAAEYGEPAAGKAKGRGRVPAKV